MRTETAEARAAREQVAWQEQQAAAVEANQRSLRDSRLGKLTRLVAQHEDQLGKLETVLRDTREALVALGDEPTGQGEYRWRCRREELQDLISAVEGGLPYWHAALAAEFVRRGWPVPERGHSSIGFLQRELAELKREAAGLRGDETA